MEARIIAALCIIAVCACGAVVALAVYLPRRKRDKLRRRGIKTYSANRDIGRRIA